jgi:hypothetical protein
VDRVNFKTQDIPVGAIPGNGQALTDIAKEMMLLSKSELLDLQINRGGLGMDTYGEPQ